MSNNKLRFFIRRHNLINKIYDMLDYFNFFNKNRDINKEKRNINKILYDLYSVETLAKFLEDKKKENYKNVELRINLIKLINELDYVKQYLYELKKEE